MSRFQVKVELEGPELWRLEEIAKTWGLSLGDYLRNLALIHARVRVVKPPPKFRERKEIDYEEYLELRNRYNWSLKAIADRFGMSGQTLASRVAEHEGRDA
jgi:predicted DNA-binding ribbon-helix-helix protein